MIKLILGFDWWYKLVVELFQYDKGESFYLFYLSLYWPSMREDYVSSVAFASSLPTAKIDLVPFKRKFDGGNYYSFLGFQLAFYSFKNA